MLDAHIHLFDDSQVAHYEALRTAYDIASALVVGYEGEAAYEGNNAAIAGWSRSRPWMACLAFVPAGADASPTLLKNLWAQNFKGISIYCSNPDEAATIERWSDEAIQALQAHQAVVSINAGPRSIQFLTRFLRRLEGCRCLISHLGLPGAYEVAPTAGEARQQLAPLLDLASCAWIGVKFSGLYAIGPAPHESAKPFVDALLDAFGADRLYWGSDFPPCLDYVSFQQTVDCVDWQGLEEEVKPGILGGNLRRLLRSVHGE